VGAYFTKSPGANYGFYGGQVQYNVLHDIEKKWAASTRLSFVSMYGPDDLDFTVFGLDVLASKELAVYSTWVSVAPYAAVSTYLANSHEKTSAVNLSDEHVWGAQAMIGAVAELSKARLGAEYSFAKVSSLSLKVGVSF
jgi:hypothetical protein